MSFRTPWRAPVKAAATTKTKTMNPSELAKESIPPNSQNIVTTEGSQLILLGDKGCATAPSSPEGSKCTEGSKEFCRPDGAEYPESSEHPKGSQGSNCPENPKIVETFKCSKLSEVTKDSDDSESPEIPKCSEGLKIAEASEGSKFPKDSEHPKSTEQSKSFESTEKLERRKVENCFEVSKDAAGSDSTECRKRSKRRENSKDAEGSDSSERRKGSKRSVSSKSSEMTGWSSEDSSSSAGDGSLAASRVSSQANSRGSQFLTQEPRLVLSPPPAGLDARARLAWIQQRRDAGVWVFCDAPGCDKQRFLPDVHDPAALPERWYCRMNTDPERNNCEAAEQGLSLAEDEDMIYSAYTAGSLVWAKLDGFPEWPAMVDDDPDYEQYYWLNGFSDIPSDYHVTFFDSAAVTRAWLKSGELRNFSPDEAGRKLTAVYGADFTHRLKVAHAQAVLALPLSPLARLRRFGFTTRFTGKISKASPRRRARPGPKSSEMQAKRRSLLDQRRLNKKRSRGALQSQKRRGSQKARASKKGHGSQKRHGSQKERRGQKGRRSQKGRVESESDFSEDEKESDSSASSSDSSVQGLAPSKKPRLETLSKATSETFAKPTFKTSPKPAFKTPFKSPAKVPQKIATATTPKSTFNTPSKSASQASRKLWMELASSSESEDDRDEAGVLASPALVDRPASTQPFAPMEMSQDLFNEDVGSDDSTDAVAGSVISTAFQPLPNLKLLPGSEPVANESVDFIDNTPCDLPTPTFPSKAAAVPSVDEQSLEVSSQLAAVLPIVAENYNDLVPPSQLDAGLTPADP